MHFRDELKRRAEAAKNKPAPLGDDVDLGSFAKEAASHDYVPAGSLESLPEDDKNQLIMAGTDPSTKGRGATFLQKDGSVIHCSSTQKGIEVFPIEKALEEHPWVSEYYWKLVSVDADKYTAATELDLHGGYVIRALPGSRTIYPLQACLYMDQENFQQTVHNIIVAEEGSELHIISGCATSPHLKSGAHVGVTEYYIRKNARVTFTMIHNWAKDMAVRPRSAAIVEEGGLFINNYICMKPAKSLQMYPVAHLLGEGAVARFYSIIAGSPGSVYDAGGRVFLKKPGNRAEIVSRAITNGGRIIARGHLIGEVEEIKAHLECKGLILNGGVIHAIPELEGHTDGVEMSHEAAVGKIAQEEINYLMSRGLSEDEAVSTIVRGFLNVDIPGLPAPLKAEIDRAVARSDRDVM
jgi:uncharacterized protein